MNLYYLLDFASKMISSAPKVNPLMNLFLKREAQHPLPERKPVKKVKPSNEKQLDPLYQILAWRDDIKPTPPPPSNSYRAFEEQDISQAKVEDWGTNLQGIFINIDWNKTSMQSFKKIVLSPTLLSNGMVFIWGAKTNIGEIMDCFDQMGYTYAENFTFILLNRSKTPSKSQKQLAGNKSLLNFFSKAANPETDKIEGIKRESSSKTECDYQIGRVTDPSEIFLNCDTQYFCESQKVLYMFRKINKKQSLQLRHQRTSDVYFTIGEDAKLDWKAKEIVYRMIETLLISANYKQKQQLRLLQMWAEKDYIRKGWITVSERTADSPI